MSAPDTKLTAQTNPELVSTDSSMTFHTGGREVLRITNEARLIIGEGLSKDEATQEVAKLLIAAFENEIEVMVHARVVNLRADLERFTGHGLLDCHAICDQRDAAVAERDQLRAEVEIRDNRIVSLRRALKDAISTYSPDREETLVTAERQEAWIKALNQ